MKIFLKHNVQMFVCFSQNGKLEEEDMYRYKATDNKKSHQNPKLTYDALLHLDRRHSVVRRRPVHVRLVLGRGDDGGRFHQRRRRRRPGQAIGVGRLLLLLRQRAALVAAAAVAVSPAQSDCDDGDAEEAEEGEAHASGGAKDVG